MELLVVLARHFRGGFGSFDLRTIHQILTPSVPGHMENAGKHEGAFGEHELISLPAYNCPEARICLELRLMYSSC